MNESSLGVHEIKLVVKSGPGLGDGCGVAQHAHSALNLGQIASRNHSRGLVVDTDLIWEGEEDDQDFKVTIKRGNCSEIKQQIS